jgi:hypothetical protein
VNLRSLSVAFQSHGGPVAWGAVPGELAGNLGGGRRVSVCDGYRGIGSVVGGMPSQLRASGEEDVGGIPPAVKILLPW